MKVFQFVVFMTLVGVAGAAMKYKANPQELFDFFKNLFWWLTGFWFILSGVLFTLSEQSKENKNNPYMPYFTLTAQCLTITLIAQGITYALASNL